MTTIAYPRGSVYVGVDTHSDVHVAVAKDELGRHFGELAVPSSGRGHRDLQAWARSFGHPEAWGVEGTGSYGAALARFLTAAGENVVEVNRPDRRARRFKGKNDTIDAEAAARAVLSGEATIVAKTGDGVVEQIRVVRVARCGAMRARTQAANALKSLVVTAPDQLRDQLRSLTTIRLVRAAARLRPGADRDVTAATKLAMRSLARRYESLEEEIKILDEELQQLTTQAAPGLVEMFGVGTDTAGALLVAAGDNPQRLRSEAAFAKLCGVAPIEASSGKTARHRLNRGGNRTANAALYRIVIVRLGLHQPTKDYAAKRTAEGKSKKEIIRCLKRHLVREVFAAITKQPAIEAGLAA
ncbi:MAG TPA: IS110 family transposase [Candidatus Limnocylindrales bacterium]|nr:IS110 family transposase [Candidatus Limnocylindrales bacterium]